MTYKEIEEELKKRGYFMIATKDLLARHLLTTSEMVEQLNGRLDDASNRQRTLQRSIDQQQAELKEKQETIDSLLMLIRLVKKNQEPGHNVNFQIRGVDLRHPGNMDGHKE